MKIKQRAQCHFFQKCVCQQLYNKEVYRYPHYKKQSAKAQGTTNNTTMRCKSTPLIKEHMHRNKYHNSSVQSPANLLCGASLRVLYAESRSLCHFSLTRGEGEKAAIILCYIYTLADPGGVGVGRTTLEGKISFK